jgi:DNA invertase Pin-like site-specific DNA recombinase
LFLDDAQGNAADMASKKRAVHGERHHSSKLTADDARAIRDDRRPSRQIAREYGISKQTVQKIKKRRTWIHA